MADSFDWTSLIGPALGAVAGGMSGAQQAGTSTSTKNPWGPMQPYLTGIAGQANNLYQQTAGMPDYMRGMYTTYFNNLNNQQNSPMSGMFNAAISRNLGFGGGVQGIDPSNAYMQLMSGQPNNPAMRAMADSVATQYNNNLAQNILPQIRSGAQAAGQYGGSRQGIAEGLAIGQSNQGLAGALANMYGNAYSQAQNNMYGATTNLANQQFAAPYNSMAAYGNFNNSQNNAMLGGIGAAMQANNYPWQALGNYSSMINGMAGLGGSQSTPYYNNPYASALGGAMIGNNLFNGTNRS